MTINKEIKKVATYSLVLTQRNRKPRPENEFKSCECGCGEIIESWDYFHCRERYFKNGHNAIGKRNNNWKGGRNISYQGYILVSKRGHYKTDQHHYVREHVFIFEEFYKCCMLPWGVVHHRDENRQNNEISNLEGMTRKRHNIIHFKGKRRRSDS